MAEYMIGVKLYQGDVIDSLEPPADHGAGTFGVRASVAKTYKLPSFIDTIFRLGKYRQWRFFMMKVV